VPNRDRTAEGRRATQTETEEASAGPSRLHGHPQNREKTVTRAPRLGAFDRRNSASRRAYENRTGAGNVAESIRATGRREGSIFSLCYFFGLADCFTVFFLTSPRPPGADPLSSRIAALPGSFWSALVHNVNLTSAHTHIHHNSQRQKINNRNFRITHQRQTGCRDRHKANHHTDVDQNVEWP